MDMEQKGVMTMDEIQKRANEIVATWGDELEKRAVWRDQMEEHRQWLAEYKAHEVSVSPQAGETVKIRPPQRYIFNDRLGAATASKTPAALTPAQEAIGRVVRSNGFRMTKSQHGGTALLGPQGFYQNIVNPTLAAALFAFLQGDMVDAIEKRSDLLEQLGNAP
jgi:hypothetical protein